MTGSRVPANLLIQLDDSGSMQWDFMPGASNSGQVPATAPVAIQLQTYTRNTLYYNPNITYQPWLTSVAGVRMPIKPYTDVYSDNVQATGSLNLSAANRIFHVPKNGITDFADARQYYRYTFLTDGTAIRQEMDAFPATTWGSTTAVTSFDWVGSDTVPFTRTLAEEKQNFANWYSYHRTRTKVAKAGVSESFNDLTEDIRVGFDTIWNRDQFGNAVPGDRPAYPVPVATDDGLFRGVNRSTFYDRLQGAFASNGTPLRSALRRAGNYFSETGNDGPYGPLIGGEQLACRQNITILTTDGYWNSDGGFAEANQDGTAGATITNPQGGSYTYTPAPPYQDTQANVLADVAMNYWKNDLRPTLDNIVPTSSADPAFWQHMVTFGISIGLQGTLNPETSLPGLISGATTWPNAVADNATAIDDLFHAAVNGHGDFVVANDPQELTESLKAALAAIIGRIGSSSNVAANSVSVGGDTRIFQASYITGQWTGEILSLPIVNSQVSATPSWKATDNIPLWTARNLITFEGTGTTFPTAAQEAFLTTPIANYVKGDRSNEKSVGGTRTLRDRVNLLGDIISSSPAYSDESKTVFVGANDGMLHAFDALTGVELFGYVPGIVNLANLKSLADDPYSHRYLVDGPISVTTTKQTPGKNILVGSLGRGGRGVFALDVTTPATFVGSNALWEVSGSDISTDPRYYMGLVTSRPIITKANNGDNVVIVSNGLNSAGDSPALYVYKLETGTQLARIVPVDADAGGPIDVIGNNGLSAATGIDANIDGKIDYVYAGDMKGNLWKFDLSSVLTTGWKVDNSGYPLFSAKNAGGTAQPITGGVAIAYDESLKPWIYFGTGRYLTAGDPASTSVQTWYGIQDANAVVTGRSQLKERLIVAAGQVNGKNVRAFEPKDYASTDDMNGKKGWYIDLVNPPYGASEKDGERIVGTPLVRGNTVVVSSIIPSEDPCASGGGGYINVIDAFTGSSGIEGSEGYLDINGNGVFSDDKLTDANGKQISIGSVDLGVFMPTDALILAGATNELIVVGGSQGGTATAPFRGSRIIGRISWHEMINN
jgi:type IV pilus assembly protein PilY1